MRDDIHRGLPVSPPWKRAVRACARDSEEGDRATLVTQAIGSELRQIQPACLDACRHALAQRSLFPGDVFAVSYQPRNPIEAAFIRECAALADGRLPAKEAIREALARAMDHRFAATGREIRAQTFIKAPQDAAELLSRLEAAARVVDFRSLADGFLAGETPPRAAALQLDLDADLRVKR